MSEHGNDIEQRAEFSQFNSLDVEEIVSEGPGDATVRPLRPELIARAEYELDRINNPTKPASMPRPGTQAPMPKQAQ